MLCRQSFVNYYFERELSRFMELAVGDILEGKVKSITNFGAFIALPENKTGMVHISEVANAFVSDIRQHLTEGQDVKVQVIGTENGKVNLSIKRLQPRAPRENAAPRRENFTPRPQENRAPRQAPQPVAPAAPKTADQLFEEKLKQFMAESDSKIAGCRQYERQHSRPRRR